MAQECTQKGHLAVHQDENRNPSVRSHGIKVLGWGRIGELGTEGGTGVRTAAATPYVSQSCDMECAPVSVAEQGKFHHFLQREGGERHKGRIERLRGQLAYGFEARTPHQRSSSWQKFGQEQTGILGTDRIRGRVRLVCLCYASSGSGDLFGIF